MPVCSANEHAVSPIESDHQRNILASEETRDPTPPPPWFVLTDDARRALHVPSMALFERDD
jgi:hypothetical protein